MPNNKTIKVIHITQTFGGVYTYIRQIVEYGKSLDIQFEIVAPYDQECDTLCKDHQISYHVIDMQRGFAPLSDISALIKIIKTLKKIKPDLVHVHSAKAGFLGRIAAKYIGVKSIYTPHGMSYLSFTGLKRMSFFLLEVFAKKYTDFVLACSQSEKLRCKYELGIPDRKITVLNNAIPPDLQVSISSGVNNFKLHIGGIARLTYQKDPLLFVEIAHEVSFLYPYATFSILGSGLHDHLKKEVEAKIKEYHLIDKFKLYQWSSFENPRDYLKTLDIFLMPSVFEGLPFSLLEAMDQGILCITSKCDGCNDVINNLENGFSCMEKKDYVEAIIKSIKENQLRYLLLQNAKNDIITKYNISHFIVNLQMLYTEVIKGK